MRQPYHPQDLQNALDKSLQRRPNARYFMGRNVIPIPTFELCVQITSDTGC